MAIPQLMAMSLAELSLEYGQPYAHPRINGSPNPISWLTMVLLADEPTFWSNILIHAGRAESPTDYLCFFCLGNRETKSPDEGPPPSVSDLSLHHKLALETRRFMIYVHSKMMIGETSNSLLLFVLFMY